MNKKILIPIIVILILAAGIGAYFVLQKSAFPEPLTPPVIKEQTSTFLMIHFEVGAAEKFPWYAEIVKGSDIRNLKYQEALWPTAIEIVNLANRYNAKLTLGFTPQWAEYILMDEKKINMIKEWQKQGHEIAYQHHGVDHPDWDGYSNMPEAKSKEGYRGTAAEGFEFLKKLAYPENVTVGTITDMVNDLPGEIKILTYGGTRNEGGNLAKTVSEPVFRIMENKETIWLGHGFLESFFHDNKKTDALLVELKEKYEEFPPNKVFGVVTHEHDFYRYPDALEEWFRYVNSKGGKIQTVKEIAEKFYPEK